MITPSAHDPPMHGTAFTPANSTVLGLRGILRRSLTTLCGLGGLKSARPSQEEPRGSLPGNPVVDEAEWLDEVQGPEGVVLGSGAGRPRRAGLRV